MASGEKGLRRAVITGLGAVSAFGWGVAALDAGLKAGRTAIGPFQRFDHTRQRTHVAGEVPAGPPPDFDGGPGWTRLSLADRFAVFAARRPRPRPAWRDALGERAAGVFFGSSTGGMLESEQYFDGACCERDRGRPWASCPRSDQRAAAKRWPR